ncbi:MAG: D-alanyl-D-alanine carboxypeptidase family protein [Ruminococcus sp.]|nr:D-alanyl-D-alanine carboxypeptidase family protein [Ruminococcus sp.]
MNRKTTKLTAFLTAITCITALASCGKDVPQSENSGTTSDLSIVEGTINNTEENQTTESENSGDNNESEESTTTAASTESGETESTTTTANGFSFVTRDPSEIPVTKKPTVTNAPAVRTTAVVPNASIPKITGNAPTVTTPPPSVTTALPTLSGITLSYYSAEVFVGQTIQYPVVSENITEIWTSSDDSIASVDAAGNITGKGEGECVIKVVSADNSNIGAEVKVTVKKADGIQQIDGITYVNGILIANKTYSLPSTYNPQGLTDDTYSAFQQLATDAAYAGLDIYLSSGFRSYETQDQIYNNYVSAYGQETADTFSARPGHSEHQTGMAIDVNSIDDSFAGTPEAVWLEEHCYEYGFIIRYPKGKDNITGYKYEPWHIRYVGKDVAQAVHNAAVACGDPTLTLEEYLGITSSYQ